VLSVSRSAECFGFLQHRLLVRQESWSLLQAQLRRLHHINQRSSRPSSPRASGTALPAIALPTSIRAGLRTEVRKQEQEGRRGRRLPRLASKLNRPSNLRSSKFSVKQEGRYVQDPKLTSKSLIAGRKAEIVALIISLQLKHTRYTRVFKM
jgi:hypothetical protein